MSRFSYSPQHLQWLDRQFKRLPLRPLTDAFNQKFALGKTPQQIASTLKNHKITSGRGAGSTKGSYRLMTKAQAAYLRRHYKNISRQQMADQFNAHFGTAITVDQLSAFTKNHGIKSGRDGRFIPGHKTHNAGTKGLMKPNSGSFTHGNPPPNTRPLGSERICKTEGYVLIKVAEENPHTGAKTRYRHKHHVVWESHHGQAPAGHLVSFKDGNRQNCSIDNLVLITRAQCCYVNRWHGGAPAPLKPSLHALAQLLGKQRQLQQGT